MTEEPPSSAGDTHSHHQATGLKDSAKPGVSWRGWLRTLVGRRNGNGTVRGAIEDLIEERESAEPSIEPDERELIGNVLALHDVAVADVMVPRADIDGVEIDMKMDELVQRMAKEARTRLPVYRESLDDVVGLVHMKDVLAALDTEPPQRLSDLVRDILFVAPSMRVLDLLLEMRSKRIHMAVVVDEFGGVDGLVTIEDLVEEIVGEIQDEHDAAEAPSLTVRADGTVLADARTRIEAFEELVGKVLDPKEREEVDTLGGLVFRLIDRVPRRGEIVRHDSGIEFEVVDADARRIRRLRVHSLPSEDRRAAARS